MVQRLKGVLVLSCSVNGLETEDITAANSAYLVTPLSLSRLDLPARQGEGSRFRPELLTSDSSPLLCNRPVGFVRLKQLAVRADARSRRFMPPAYSA
jgi:hypothetical protein